MKKNKTIFFFLAIRILLMPIAINCSWYCDRIPVAEILKNNPEISYKACSPAKYVEYEKLPVAENHYLHPYKGTFQETFILNIPKGQVYGVDGHVLVGDSLINELVWQNCALPKHQINDARQNKPIKKNSRMAVIAQSGNSFYYHWIVEILGRLALLEQAGEEYDYLYVPTYRPFMKEALLLWGVSPDKIIDSTDDVLYEVDELIVPSLIASIRTDGSPRLAHYAPKEIVEYVKNKLIDSFEKQNEEYSFCKKVFISRSDAQFRKILNEDEVFEKFAAQGFERYILSNLSLVEQIALFKNAEIIVGTLGSGLTNILFCNTDALVVDIFQARRDCTIYYLSQTLGLQYKCVKTMEFIDQNDGQFDMAMPLDVVEKLLDELFGSN
jgi:capsular polysaccharide biosynthesis protein